MRYNFNENYFDEINTSEKAYWIGFLWADGYIGKRDRRKNLEYNLKFSLNEDDATHLEKFNNCINGTYPIHIYKAKGFNKISSESRLFITSTHFCGRLYEHYKLQPNREYPEQIISELPKELRKDLIRGIFDGDGSFSAYQKSYGKKISVTFGGCEKLLKFIEKHFEENEIIVGNDRKTYQRHKGKDGSWRSMTFSGVPQGMKILNYLYKDATIYLDRKYQKYLNLPYHNN